MTRTGLSPVAWLRLGLIALGLFTNLHFVSSEDLLLNLNPKKVVAVTSDKFLSLTIDPAVLLSGDVLTSSTELSTNMAKALAPGYVRLAGPRSNSYTFERSLFPQNGYEDPDHTFSEAHWVLVQQWAQRAGLDVVSTLNPRRIENEDQVSSWDPRNSLDLISFSDHMGYNISWQLGYECQTRCDVSGVDLGRDVARLRHMLGAFPRYTNSIIAGPDFVSFRGRQQQQFIQDYLSAAGNALSVITWHPDFAGIALDSDGVALQVDTLAADKDLLYKSMGRNVAKKPLWIAESKPEECKRQFLGALVWARRLGSAAKLGVQVIMRQPDASNLFQATPDYWVSLLHKMLVGREVLDAKLTSGNKTHVHFYCQCTKPSAKYDRGAITIFGINLTPGKVSVALKGLKIKAVHKYILMPGFDNDNRMFAETVLLNNEPLTLENGKNLPEINPAVALMGKNMAVKLPSGGIGFWVIPGARVKLCMGHDEEPADKNLLLKKFSKKLEEAEVTGDENLGHESDDEIPDFDADSAEDIKSILKPKKKWRKNRHSDEADEEDRKFKRIDTKKELEKLEKLLKRNNPEEKKPSHFKGRVGLSPTFESDENKESYSSEEDDGLVRFKNDKTDSGEDIRAKLEEYKNKLIEYEARKKKDSRNVSFPTEAETQKALEALALISKVENSMGSFGTSRSDKITLENRRDLDLATDIGEEMLIEELERSDQTKRMTDPKAFGPLYQILANGQDKPRDKRDLEKLLNDDPLGLRKEGLFKKRLKADEAKERRLERRMRKKEKDEIIGKKEHSIPKIISADSNENNFFGFPQMKPLPNFPKGDLFLSEGTSDEDKNNDYDYVKDDDGDEDEIDSQKQRNSRRGKGQQKKKPEIEDQTWIEEPDADPALTHVPREFFERLNHPKVKIQTQWKGFDELYEPESIMQREIKEDKKTAEDHDADDVVVKDHLDDRDDKRAKETAVKKLISYYDNSDVLKTETIPEISRPKEKNRVRIHAHTSPKKEVEAEKKKFEVSEEDSMEFFNSKSVEDYSEDDYNIEEESAPRKRPKRRTPRLDDEMFKKEMIREDAGNSKDCECRVIRNSGRLDSKDCRKSRRNRPQRDLTEAEVESTTDPILENEEAEANQEEEEVVGSQKNIEADEPEELIPEVDEAESSIATTSEPVTSYSEDSEPPVIAETVAEESPDDVVGSAAQINDEDIVTEPVNANLGEIVDDKEKLEIPEASEIANIEEKFNSVREANDGGEKIEIPLPSEAATEEETVASVKTEAAVEGKSKSGLDLKLKSGKSKFALNTEALSTLIKESESKKADAMKAFETSAKLKSNENAKYVEYQKKRAEKLSNLKEKLKERKAKVLQQYRQELVDALNKCDDEMKRNLKRREILEDLSELEEFQDFVDKDKLAYVMMHRPVNYEGKIDDEDKDRSHEGKYYPNIDMIQPLRSPREQRIPSAESKRYFHVPEKRHQVYPTSKESSEEGAYYAIVESLENPKIISAKHFREFTNDGDSDETDYGHRRGSLMHKKHRPTFYDAAILEEEPRDVPWNPITAEYQDTVLQHRQYKDLGESGLYDPVPPTSRNQQYSEGPSFEIVRKQREVRDKQQQPNYICLKADSAEDLTDDEHRLFRLVRSDDHFEALPISGFPEDLGPRKQRKVLKEGEKVRHRRRKDHEGRYYLRKDETDYRIIGDESNRLETDPRISPEEYELLMLIPVKKNKAKRHRRDLDNSIDRTENYDDMNEVWGDIVDVKDGEDKLQKYLDEKEKTVKDFEEAQASMNKYLKKLGDLTDPQQLETFDKFILNLGAPEQDKIAVVASQDDLDRTHLGEYLKKEIIKQVHGEGPTTVASGSSEDPPSLFEETMPKLEGVLNEELEKVEKLTESFEDFIDEFDQNFNFTSGTEDKEIEIEVPEEKKKKISYNIFHTALENVKKFFNFLTGCARIFHRH